MVLMDHFKTVSAQSPHNGMSALKLSTLFGPLLFCASNPKRELPPEVAASAAAAQLSFEQKRQVDCLDARLAADMLHLLLDVWPGRTSNHFEIILFKQ